MTNIVVAETVAHAKAMIGWLGLDHSWHPVAYGEDLFIRYQYAKVVRPFNGATDEHVDWILEQLVPNLDRKAESVPSSWSLTVSADRAGTALSGREVATIDNLHG
jgi:hypothetical protein